MKPASFAYHRAVSVGEALELLTREGEDAKVIAGGQSLVPLMAFRLARPSALIDITRISDLRYVRRDGDVLRIGALATHRDVETNAEPGVLDGYAILPRAARFIGHYPIRTRGTFGGSIAHADPTSEWCMLAMLLDAEIVVTGAQGPRVVAAPDFFRGVFTTALGTDEVVTEVRFPSPAPRSAIREFARRQGDFAIVAASAAVEIEDGLVRSARIALAGVGDAPVRAPEAEALLGGAAPTEAAFAEAGRTAAAGLRPPSDIHGSSGYRTQLASALVRRALTDAVHADG
ncbi:MAG TPA: xanthine dehydrogenase family protein subunit M [Actinomycetota bacterium]|nr:xanthine dehydrogenase family protein subunit M [Actinomycetota bacterium]